MIEVALVICAVLVSLFYVYHYTVHKKLDKVPKLLVECAAADSELLNTAYKNKFLKRAVVLSARYYLATS